VRALSNSLSGGGNGVPGSTQRKPPRLTTVPSDVLIRAAAITLITFDHSLATHVNVDWFDGGITVLMMLSGLNFARFGLAGVPPSQTVRALVRLARELFTAIVVIVLLIEPLRQTSFFTARGFVYTFTGLPLWYAQVMIFICLGLACLFLVPQVGKAFARAPLLASLVLLAAAIAIRALAPASWDTFGHRTAYLLLWNFVLGWVVFFLMNRSGWWRYAAGFAVISVSGYIGWGLDGSSVFYLVAGGMFLLAVKSVRLPAPVARIVNIIAQATFFIYLTHWIFLQGIAGYYVPDSVTHVAVTARFVISVLGTWVLITGLSVACWIAWTSASRAYNAEAAATGRDEPIPDPQYLGAGPFPSQPA